MGEDIFYMFLTFIINVISQIVAYQIVKILELHNKNKSKNDRNPSESDHFCATITAKKDEQ